MPCILYVITYSLKGILLNFGYVVLVRVSSFISFLSKFRNSVVSQNAFKEDHNWYRYLLVVFNYVL
jgi:hypothetical protein